MSNSLHNITFKFQILFVLPKINYPDFQLSELQLVLINLNNRVSTVLLKIIKKFEWLGSAVERSHKSNRKVSRVALDTPHHVTGF